MKDETTNLLGTVATVKAAPGPRPDMGSEAIMGRMAQFCGCFEVDPVKLQVRKGGVYLTNDLIA